VLAADFNDMADAVSGLVTEVKERESQLTNVMNSVDDGLVVLDRDFRVLAAKQRLLSEVWSAPGGAARPPVPRGARPRASVRRVQGQLPEHAVSRKRGVAARDVQVPSEDGEPGRVEEVHASPVFDENGKVAQVVEILA